MKTIIIPIITLLLGLTVGYLMAERKSSSTIAAYQELADNHIVDQLMAEYSVYRAMKSGDPQAVQNQGGMIKTKIDVMRTCHMIPEKYQQLVDQIDSDFK